MPELRGIRALVPFFQQSAEPCAAPPTSPFIFHGFADGFSGCQSAGSFPALFIRLRLHHPFSPAKHT